MIVNLDADGSYELDEVLEGDTVSDVLSYVHYDRKQMVARLRRACERAVRRGALSLEDSRLFMKNYVAGLEGYTYLE